MVNMMICIGGDMQAYRVLRPLSQKRYGYQSFLVTSATDVTSDRLTHNAAAAAAAEYITNLRVRLDDQGWVLGSVVEEEESI